MLLHKCAAGILGSKTTGITKPPAAALSAKAAETLHFQHGTFESAGISKDIHPLCSSTAILYHYFNYSVKLFLNLPLQDALLFLPLDALLKVYGGAKGK